MKFSTSLVFFVTVVSLVVCQYPAHSDSTSQRVKITNSWFSQFKSIRSMKFEWTHKVLAHPVKESVGQKSETKFALNGTKFRSENLLPAYVKNTSVTVDAYDGTLYQHAVTGPQGTLLTHSKEMKTDLPYGTSLPVLNAYDFAFGSNAVRSIQTLQERETWQKVLRRITGLKEESIDGRQGLWVRMKGTSAMENYQVLIDKVSLLPVITRRELQVRTGPKSLFQVSTIEVKERLTITKSGKKVDVPVLVSGKLTQNGNIYVEDVDEVRKSSVQINIPVNRSLFTIPKSQAAVVIDADDEKNKSG